MSRSSNNEEVIEEEKTEEVVSGNNHVSRKDCMKIGGLDFEICVGRAYSFLIGRRTIIGIVDEINPRFFRAKLTTERGTVIIDLRKVSVIEEVR